MNTENSREEYFLHCTLWNVHAFLQLQRIAVEYAAKFVQVEHSLSGWNFPYCGGHQQVVLQKFPKGGSRESKSE